MIIGGFQETSLLDYPGKVAAILWTAGCNFRCPFCYNKQLVFNETDEISIDTLLSFLQKRKGKLDAVSITGGEPFLHDDLIDLIQNIKDLGYLVKVDTNGCFPDKLQSILSKGLIDYVSMDVKATKEKYDLVAGVDVDIKAIDASIDLIKNMAPDYEFKTTVIPTYHSMEDILKIAQWLKGSKRYFIQQFKITSSLISVDLSSVRPYDNKVLSDMYKKIESYFDECHIRGI